MGPPFCIPYVFIQTMLNVWFLELGHLAFSTSLYFFFMLFHFPLLQIVGFSPLFFTLEYTDYYVSQPGPSNRNQGSEGPQIPCCLLLSRVIWFHGICGDINIIAITSDSITYECWLNFKIFFFSGTSFWIVLFFFTFCSHSYLYNFIFECTNDIAMSTCFSS